MRTRVRTRVFGSTGTHGYVFTGTFFFQKNVPVAGTFRGTYGYVFWVGGYARVSFFGRRVRKTWTIQDKTKRLLGGHPVYHVTFKYCNVPSPACIVKTSINRRAAVHGQVHEYMSGYKAGEGWGEWDRYICIRWLICTVGSHLADG